MLSTESHFMIIYAPVNDKELREGIRCLYDKVIHATCELDAVVIKLPLDKWISLLSLNMLMIFIESVLYKIPQFRICIELFDVELALELLENPDASALKKSREQFSRKIIFYDAVDIINLLVSRNVMVSPSPKTIIELQEKIGANKKQREFLYSTSMLQLTMRIRTLTSILYHNLGHRLDLDSIREASDQIMFELVKNIYQHSELPSDYTTKSRGFACAQINPISTIVSPQFDDLLIKAALDHKKKSRKQSQWKWLCISVNDFGVSISKKVYDFLFSKNDKDQKIGRYTIRSTDKENDSLLIKVAATTDFSTKLIHAPQDEEDNWSTKEEDIPLAGKGHGLIYCLNFIGKTCGRMRIRSRSVEVDFFIKVEAFLDSSIWENIENTELFLREKSEDILVIETRIIPENASRFPGTQILIEVPVEIWFDKDEPEKDKKEAYGNA